MRCEEFRDLIAIEADGSLADGDSSVLSEHLTVCPLCRQERDDIRNLTRGLRMMRRPTMPKARLASLRTTVSVRAGATGFWIAEDRRPWRQAWLMPSSVGTFASVVLGIAFLWLLTLSPVRVPQSFAENVVKDDQLQMAYVEQRVDVSSESPSINPQGALVALTNSLVRGEMKEPCQAGIKTIHVDPAGHVKRCPDFPVDFHWSEYKKYQAVDCNACYYACRGEAQAPLRLSRVRDVMA